MANPEITRIIEQLPKDHLRVLNIALQWSRDDIRAEFSDGSGEPSPEQTICRELSEAVQAAL
jgi:hypothetical protein